MRTIREAAALLARLTSPDDIALILPALGFGGELSALDSESVRALGLASLVSHASIARGSGTLRALVVNAPSSLPPRDAVRKISERLSRSSPHILWLLFVFHRASRSLAVAAWSIDDRRQNPRAAALVVELDHVVDSDGETLCSLAAVRDSVDLVAHSRWVELLGREALTRRFYRTLEQIVRSMSADMKFASRADDTGELALLQVSRLLFLSFLEAKGWLDSDRGFLSRTFNECMSHGGNYHRRVLLPLLFGTLNTPLRRRARAARSFGRIPFLNGGLFTRTATEKANRRAWLSDDQYGDLFGLLLSRYRFTAREDSSSWSEAAIDPEMMGKAFESLMILRARHSTGAFYTPQVMVERVSHSALLEILCSRSRLAPEHIESALAGRNAGADATRTLLLATADLRVLDPACGSGAFLVHMLERVAALRTTLGDDRPVALIRRDVLSRSIFGVDINPMAVWLCELRLWLSIVIDSAVDDPCAVDPLPNLDHNIRAGDSLAGGDLQGVTMPQKGPQEIRRIRERYIRSTGSRKKHLGRVLERRERQNALALMREQLRVVTEQRRDIIARERSKDLFGERTHSRHARIEAQAQLREQSRRLRTTIRSLERGGALPFSFASHFPEAAAAGGFDIVLGNPPWVRVERIPAESRVAWRRQFMVFSLPAWEPPMQNKRGPGFAPQVDLAALFAERSLSLLREGGTLALIMPAKLWRSLAGSGLRQLLLRQSRIAELEDWSDASPAFDAVVYPSVIVVRRTHATSRDDVRRTHATSHDDVILSVRERRETLRWSVQHDSLSYDSTSGSPWLLIPSEVRAAFQLLAGAGTPFGDSVHGPPRLGVKCGCNGAFLVHVQARDNSVAVVRSGTRSGRVEEVMLRPLVRGDSIQAWGSPVAAEQIIWTHGDDSRPVGSLPPLARRWFLSWRSDLSRRTDLKDGMLWWSLFRTDGADTAAWRVVWSDISRAPRATVIAPRDPVVPLNSCYVAMFPAKADALALAALLNSAVCAAWLNILAEQARGGYHRYMAWTVSLLPLPRDWERARNTLAPIAERALSGSPPTAAELADAVLHAYNLRHESVEPLLTWNDR